MTVACIVQARITSNRLPGKVMYPLGSSPAIAHVFVKAKAIPGVDKVICTVPEDPRSEVIAHVAAQWNVEVRYGSEDDVLERYWEAAQGSDVIVRITGDCPLIDPYQCGKVLSLLMDSDDGTEYTSNCFPRNCNKGLDCEAFTFEALDDAFGSTENPYDREHVTPWMQRNVKIKTLKGECDRTVNLCLDTPEDYIRLKRMFD